MVQELGWAGRSLCGVANGGAPRVALSVRAVRLWRFHLHFALLLIIILIIINAALRIGTQLFGTDAGPTRVSVKTIGNYVETDSRFEINQWFAR